MAKKSKKNILPRPLERAGVLCLAFANSGAARRDDRRKSSKAPPELPLTHYDELVLWVQRMGALSDARGERLRRAGAEQTEDAAAVLTFAIALRRSISRLFTGVALNHAPRLDDLAILNGHLRPRQAISEGGGFRWGWPEEDEDDLERPLWTIAQSAVELLVSDDLANVDQCASKGCYQLFVRRHSRRLWCDMNTCGNRYKGRRYQQYLRSIRKGIRRRDEERLRRVREARERKSTSQEA